MEKKKDERLSAWTRYLFPSKGRWGFLLIFSGYLASAIFFIFENNGISVVFDDMYGPFAGLRGVLCVFLLYVVSTVFPHGG